MIDRRKTKVAMLTAPGRGAIATIVVSGPMSEKHVDAFFESASGIPVENAPVGRILFGRWRSEADSTGEELVVCRTENGTVEVHSHGGFQAPTSIMQALTSAGCEPTDWYEYLDETNVGESKIKTESTIALTEATTQKTAAHLAAQLNGALENELAHIIEISRQNFADAKSKIQTLLARAEFGIGLTTARKIVIAGAPNVGKSSLINCLAGFERSIVFDQPGTTRDALTTQTAINGFPVELVDTAGIRITAEAVEAAGIARAATEIEDADLVVIVNDASDLKSSSGIGEQKMLAESRNSILVYNKIDRAGDDRPTAGFITTSATEKIGIDTLIDAITANLWADEVEIGSPIPFTRRQIDLLRSAVQQNSAAPMIGLLQQTISASQ